MKVSEILGKALISIADAKTVGVVSNVWFDDKLLRAKTVEILSDEDNFPERSFVRFNALDIGGDAAVVRSLSQVENKNLSTAPNCCPINNACYDRLGTELGKVRDIVLEGDAVTQIYCEKATLTPSRLISLSDELCVFNDSDKPYKLPKPRRKSFPTPKVAHAAMPVALHDQSVVTQTPQTDTERTPLPPSAQEVRSLRGFTAGTQADSTVATPTSPQNVTVTRTPGDPVKDYGFLLGKPVRSNITSGGTTLIPAGTVVDENTIELARREGKLVQLALRAY